MPGEALFSCSCSTRQSVRSESARRGLRARPIGPGHRSRPIPALLPASRCFGNSGTTRGFPAASEVMALSRRGMSVSTRCGRGRIVRSRIAGGRRVDAEAGREKGTDQRVGRRLAGLLVGGQRVWALVRVDVAVGHGLLSRRHGGLVLVELWTSRRPTRWQPKQSHRTGR